MSIGKILASVAKFGWNKIIKPAAVEHGPEILADVALRRSGRATEAPSDVERGHCHDPDHRNEDNV